MKNSIYNGIFAVLGISMFMIPASCTFEDEDYFDESAALRIEHFNEKVVNTLKDSEHGWVMNYFTGTPERHAKGFNLFARFYENERVTIAGNHEFLRNGNANKYIESESLYTMLQENGPVLSFNTWNDVLTVFSDPVSPYQAPDNIVKDGVGMAGDHDFTVVSCDDDVVKLVGVRYEGNVRLVKCDRPWKEYIDAVNERKSAITNNAINSYYVVCGSDTMYFNGLRNGVFEYCERLSNAVMVDSIACCFTPTGFFIEKEQKIGDTPFQEFVMADDNSKLLSLDGKVECIALWDQYVVDHTAKWGFEEESLNEEFKAACQAIDAELRKVNANYSLESMAIGRTTGGNSVTGLVITLYTNAAKTRTNNCGISLDMQRVGYGRMSYSLPENPKKDTNMTTFCKRNPQLENAVKDFVTLLSGVYDMVPDDYFRPTGAVYTALDGSKTFTLR